MLNQIYCIYHNSCLDGFTAAWAVYSRHPSATFIPAQYGPESYAKARAQLPENLEGCEIIIVDFSFPYTDMMCLFSEVHAAEASYLVWLDHHKTAFEAFGFHPTRFYSETDKEWQKVWPSTDVVLDNYRSGAMIAWQYFHPDETVPDLVRAVDDTDRWVHKLSYSKAMTKAVWSYAPWKFETFGEYAHPESKVPLIQTGEVLMRKQEVDVSNIISGGRMNCWISTPPDEVYAPIKGVAPAQADMFTMLGYAANCPPHLASDVGHELATSSGTYGLCWCLDKNNVVKCSLRSNGDYDVSAIAKAFGGGGHRNAAGFHTSMDVLLSFIQPQ